MKHVFMGVGCIAGVVIANVLSDSSWLPWVLGFVGCVLGHQLPGFLKYHKSSPKDFLAFHAPPDTTLTATNSVGMLNDALAKLSEGGLLLGFSPTIASARVNEAVWLSLSEAEQATLVQILVRAVFLNSGMHSAVDIYAGNAATLHRIWPEPDALENSLPQPSTALPIIQPTPNLTPASPKVAVVPTEEPALMKIDASTQGSHIRIIRFRGESESDYRLRIVKAIQRLVKGVYDTPKFNKEAALKINELLEGVDLDMLEKSDNSDEALAWLYKQIDELVLAGNATKF